MTNAEYLVCNNIPFSSLRFGDPSDIASPFDGDDFDHATIMYGKRCLGIMEFHGMPFQLQDFMEWLDEDINLNFVDPEDCRRRMIYDFERTT